MAERSICYGDSSKESHADRGGGISALAFIGSGARRRMGDIAGFFTQDFLMHRLTNKKTKDIIKAKSFAAGQISPTAGQKIARGRTKIGRAGGNGREPAPRYDIIVKNH